MKRKVSFSIAEFQRQFGDRGALAMAKAVGADAVDFNLIPEDYRKKESKYALGEDSVRKYYAELGEYAKSIGIEIAQTHGRLAGFKNIKDEDDALIENARYDCIATAALGAPHCVMHTVTTIHMGPEADRELMHALNYDMYARMLPFAKQENIKIATETFGDAAKYGCIDFFGDINEFEEGYRRVSALPDADKYFCICMDTGHSNKSTRFNNNPPSADVIRRLGSSIEVLHLNDNDTLTDQHLTPMMGNMDWNDIMNALDEIGYDGYYNMEINLKHFGRELAVEHARFSVCVMKNILRAKYGEDQ